jgi:hypothetical protein
MEIVNPFAISSNSEEEEESENKAAETIPEMMKMTKTSFDEAENICRNETRRRTSFTALFWDPVPPKPNRCSTFDHNVQDSFFI